MKAPIALTPCRYCSVLERSIKLIEDVARFGKYSWSQMRDRFREQVGFEHSAEVDNLTYLAQRKARHHRTLTWLKLEQTLSLQLSHGFTQGDTTYFILASDGHLIERFSLFEFTTHDSFAQGIYGGSNKSLAW
jgi:hypothetical protein